MPVLLSAMVPSPPHPSLLTRGSLAAPSAVSSPSQGFQGWRLCWILGDMLCKMLSLEPTLFWFGWLRVRSCPVPSCSSPGGILRRHQVRLQRREVRCGRRGGPRHPHRHRQSPGEDAEGRALRPLPRAPVRGIPAGMPSSFKLSASEVVLALVEDGDSENRTLQESLGVSDASRDGKSDWWHAGRNLEML